MQRDSYGSFSLQPVHFLVASSVLGYLEPSMVMLIDGNNAGLVSDWNFVVWDEDLKCGVT